MLQPETSAIQNSLGAYCRTGAPVILPGAKADRLTHYRRLVFGVVQDTLETAYPLTHHFLPEAEWEALAERFFGNHACQSAQLWLVPREFWQYFKAHEKEMQAQYPFLEELLHFEWLEIELHNMEDKAYPSFQIEGDWLKDKISFNPEHVLLPLSYPVHTMPAAEIRHEHAGAYAVLLFREKITGNVEFIHLSLTMRQLMEALLSGQTVEEALQFVFGLPAENEIFMKVYEQLTLILRDLQAKGFVLGFQHKSQKKST